MKRTTFTIAGLGLVLLGALAGQWFHGSTSETDREAFRTLQSAYEVIRDSYVEPVPPGSLAASSLRGMTETLDPFSVYIPGGRMKQIEESFSGSFEGIGISYELIEGPTQTDTIAVTTVLPGGPSAEAGLRAGDRIVRVAGEPAIGWSHQKIRRRLKGPQGSSVSVTLRRPGRTAPLERTITRDTVPLETVDAAYMMGDRTGYIRLNRFARTTHREVTSALRSLEDDGMTRLIFDLRGNAGGLMSMAEKVADEFLVEGQLIVRARSRHEQYGGARYASDDGRFQEAPVIVLVDEHSASASEIVAGALQDHDRAVIVGRRTFGKGLVQRQYDLSDGSGLRLTVARFYTPSGRLLQRDGKSRDSLSTPVDTANVPDSLRHRTDAGRVVLGEGGIVPDRLVADSIENSYRRAVTRQGLVRDFARRWADTHTVTLRRRWEHRPDAFAADFALPSTAYPAFVRYAAEHGVRAGPEPAPVAAAASSSQAARPASRREAEAVESEVVTAARSAIETDIKAYVGQRLFGTSMLIRVRNRIDPVVRSARQSWDLAQKWAARYPIRDE
ncbi:MAG: S41 family peptidase [Salinivenus sp.]